MGLSEQIRQQLINSFKAEQREHIQQITQGLLILEKEPHTPQRPAVLAQIFRAAHSLKGAARAVSLPTIESLGHGLEELLLNTKENPHLLSPALFDLLYQTLDAIDLVMAQIDTGDTTTPAKVLALLVQLEEMATTLNQPHSQSQPASPEEPASENDAYRASTPARTATDETIRVSVSKLDALMAQFTALISARNRAQQRLTDVRHIQTFAANWYKEWAALAPQCHRLLRQGANGHPPPSQEVAALLAFTLRNQEQLRAFTTQSNTLYRQFAHDTMHLSLLIQALQEEIKRVRMLPLTTITAPFARMVRDLARAQDKQITFTLSGDKVELDKRVLEQIKDPLIHLLRNAVSHGIESAAVRQAAGKSPEGHITLSATQQGDHLDIVLQDDGAGLHLDTIRQTAVSQGLINQAAAAQFSDAEVAQLIFHAGLSTTAVATDISGRGIGLDVVRQNVEALHGSLNVVSQAGQGTTFTITIPLTLASSHGLLVTAADQTFALPLAAIDRLLHIQPHEIGRIAGQEAITYQGQPIALAWLADLLELPPTPKTTEQLTVVITAVADKRLGLVVDDLVGEQEIVIKSLGQQLAKVGGIAGATVLGSGQVVLVLHIADLMKLADHIASRPPAPVSPQASRHTPSPKTILIVDDSITTRTLEKNILETAGYQVQVATNGAEALSLLTTNRLPDLIVSDINMPTLDGFALTQRLKQDQRYQDIPIILVTSLDSPSDKARGIEVGADAYIVKSQFDQGDLLETIAQFIW